MYEICLGRPLPENGQEWQDIRHGILQPMTNTPFELQMIVRTMLAPEKKSRPSAADLLKKRQLMSDEQRQLIVERNKANAANMALNQMVSCCYFEISILANLFLSSLVNKKFSNGSRIAHFHQGKSSYEATL